MFHLWHQRHDGMSGHVFLLEDQMRDLREELTRQGMACGRREGAASRSTSSRRRGTGIVSPIEIDEALAVASREPAAMSDVKLWQDFLDFLAGASERGGLRVR